MIYEQFDCNVIAYANTNNFSCILSNNLLYLFIVSVIFFAHRPYICMFENDTVLEYWNVINKKYENLRTTNSTIEFDFVFTFLCCIIKKIYDHIC